MEAFDGQNPDCLFDRAARLVTEHGYVTAAFLQRSLLVGYRRAVRLLGQLEGRGIISSAEGTKPREVLMTAEEYRKTAARTESTQKTFQETGKEQPMNATEKAAYLRGLMEGLAPDEAKPETKIMKAMADVIDTLCAEVEALKIENERIDEFLEELDRDLGDVEEELFDCYDGEEDEDDDEEEYCSAEECDGSCETCELNGED